jgi:hypothetical protein
MSDRTEEWYDSYYSIMYVPPGEIPQTKGPWTSMKPLEEMLDHLRAEKPAETVIYLVTSRCGSIDVESEKEYRFKVQAYAEAYEAEIEYKRLGKCSDCGACSIKESETMCRPTGYPSGEYSCAGEGLWEVPEEEETEKEGEEFLLS